MELHTYIHATYIHTLQYENNNHKSVSMKNLSKIKVIFFTNINLILVN